MSGEKSLESMGIVVLEDESSKNAYSNAKDAVEAELGEEGLDDETVIEHISKAYAGML